MGGSPPSMPGPSKEERALQKEQTELLRFQREILISQNDQQKALLPFFAKSAGIGLNFDDEGNVTGAFELDSEQKSLDRANQLSFSKRTAAALSGTLPVDPALEQNLTNQEQTLRERLVQQFGAGYETSTPGIQSLQEFQKSAEALRFGARTGQMTLAEQLGLARQGQELQNQQQQMGVFRQSSIGDPLSIAGGFNQNAAGYNAPLNRMQQERSLQFQAQMAGHNSQNQMMGGIGQMFGSLFGAVAMSDIRMKDDLVPIGHMENSGLVIYSYTMPDGKHFGLIADDVEKLWPDLVVEDAYGLKQINYWGVMEREANYG